MQDFVSCPGSPAGLICSTTVRAFVEAPAKLVQGDLPPWPISYKKEGALQDKSNSPQRPHRAVADLFALFVTEGSRGPELARRHRVRRVHAPDAGVLLNFLRAKYAEETLKTL